MAPRDMNRSASSRLVPRAAACSLQRCNASAQRPPHLLEAAVAPGQQGPGAAARRAQQCATCSIQDEIALVALPCGSSSFARWLDSGSRMASFLRLSVHESDFGSDIKAECKNNALINFSDASVLAGRIFSILCRLPWMRLLV